MLRTLRRLGWYRGVLGGRRDWAAVWALVGFVGLVRRALQKEPEVVAVEKLRRGQQLTIVSLGPPETRRQRRRRRRRERRAPARTA